MNLPDGWKAEPREGRLGMVVTSARGNTVELVPCRYIDTPEDFGVMLKVSVNGEHCCNLRQDFARIVGRLMYEWSFTEYPDAGEMEVGA